MPAAQHVHAADIAPLRFAAEVNRETLGRLKYGGKMIRIKVWVLASLLALSLVAGCGRSGEIDTILTTQTIQSADSTEPTPIPDIGDVDPAPVCPTARGVGTVSPAVSIYSITFLVNGIEQVVLEYNVLQVVPGDELQIKEVIICAGFFPGDGGQACVDFAPIDQNGQEIMSEHKGTDTVPVIPGRIIISDLNFTWTVDENWSGFYAVLNHWTPVETQDLGCASGRCERDDQLIVEFH